MNVYHKTGIRLVGVGHCGPLTPLDLPADEAKKLAKNPDWSLTPFDNKQEQATPAKKAKAVSDAQ